MLIFYIYYHLFGIEFNQLRFYLHLSACAVE